MVKHQELSPAKINLMLRILSQRQDGYHNLQTCFQLLNWGDWITFEQINETGDNQIELIGFGDLPIEENLIYQAAQMVKPWAQLSSDWKITVDKQIPMGAGLGGGSSNAASTMKFLSQWWQCDLSTFDLLAMATQLGADVPVFILGQGALGKGIGEQLTPVKFNTPHILLLLPDVAINTTTLFAANDLCRDQSELRDQSIHDLAFWTNDFFPVVLRRYPEIKSLYNSLKPAMPLRLSGTGSTLFALFEDEQQAKDAWARAAQECETVLVKPLSA